MKVLVTGASGMLGRSVAQTLMRHGHQVTVLQRRPSGLAGDLATQLGNTDLESADRCEEHLGDITDTAAVASAVAGQQAVVHLAARVSPTGSWRQFRAVNIEGTENLVAHSQRAGVSRFIYVSSPAVASSGAAHVGAPAVPANPATTKSHYARSKAIAEQFVLNVDDKNMLVAAVRPHLVWGPGDEQLVARIVDRARSGTLRLVGSGAALVDSTYIDNAADAIAAALERADVIDRRAIVISNGEPRPVAELLRGICGAAGLTLPDRGVPTWAVKTAGAMVEAIWAATQLTRDPPMTRFLAEQLSTAHWYDQHETRALLDWEPRVSIDEGLRLLAEWYRLQQ